MAGILCLLSNFNPQDLVWVDFAQEQMRLRIEQQRAFELCNICYWSMVGSFLSLNCNHCEGEN